MLIVSRVQRLFGTVDRGRCRCGNSSCVDLLLVDLVSSHAHGQVRYANELRCVDVSLYIAQERGRKLLFGTGGFDINTASICGVEVEVVLTVRYAVHA